MLLGLPAASVSVAGPQAWEPTPGGWASGPIEHVATVPFEAGTAFGAVLEDGFLYVTTWRSFSIYDVSNPRSPALESITPLGPYAFNESPATNGEILLLGNDLQGTLGIWDVTDKTAPEELATVTPPSPEHIWTCVADCEFAYGSGGAIADLSDPASPEFVGDWQEEAPTRGNHSIAEVAPGTVLTGSLPQYLLDVAFPADPRIVAIIEPPTTAADRPFVVIGPAPESLPGQVGWPRAARDRFALTTLETPFSGTCNERSGGLVAYDTRGYAKSGRFKVAGEFRITENGAYPDGLAPGNALGCSPLGFDPHPAFKKTRLVAVAWFEHGVRLLQIGKKGSITEVGGFIGHGAEAVVTVWADEETLYVIDQNRGIDILAVNPSGS
jgi:hypothetical protein